MLVELGGVYAEYEDSLRQVAKQLLKRLLHTRLVFTYLIMS